MRLYLSMLTLIMLPGALFSQAEYKNQNYKKGQVFTDGKDKIEILSFKEKLLGSKGKLLITWKSNSGAIKSKEVKFEWEKGYSVYPTSNWNYYTLRIKNLSSGSSKTFSVCAPGYSKIQVNYNTRIELPKSLDCWHLFVENSIDKVYTFESRFPDLCVDNPAIYLSYLAIRNLSKLQ
jgi:hypothetical protein